MNRISKGGKRGRNIAGPDSPDQNTSTEEENNDCKLYASFVKTICNVGYNNPLKRKQHDTMKLQLQQKEMYRVSTNSYHLSNV